MKRTLLVLAVALGAVACRDIDAIEAATPLDDLSRVDRARVDLGKRLFGDRALSADGTVSCASCHAVAEGGADVTPVSMGVASQLGTRNAPTVLNAGLKQHLFWDGRADTLEEQALGPLRAEQEMGAKDEDVLAYLRGDPSYAAAFATAFPDAPVDMSAVAAALATYQRQLVTPSRVDAFLLGDEAALDATEQRGMAFFRSNCAFCHDGPGVGGQRFEKLGDEEPWPEDRSQDLGRFEVTHDDGDRLVFAVPQLRNVGRTAPYFHDGSVETLEEAVRLMGKHQLGEELTPDVVADVAAFLRALDGEPDNRLVP